MFVARRASFSAASGPGFWGCNRRKSGCEEAGRLQSASIWALLCRRSRDIRVCAGMARPARGRSLAGGDFFLSRLGAEADIIISIPTSNPTAHMTLAIAKGLPPSAYSFWVLSPRETVYSIQTDAARRDAYYSGPMRDGEKTKALFDQKPLLYEVTPFGSTRTYHAPSSQTCREVFSKDVRVETSRRLAGSPLGWLAAWLAPLPYYGT